MPYQLTPADIEAIQRLARRIEPLQRTVRRTISGAQLLDMGYNDVDCKSINPTAQYAVDVIKEANTTLVLIDIARQQGMQVVHDAIKELGPSRAKLMPHGAMLLLRNDNQVTHPAQ